MAWVGAFSHRLLSFLQLTRMALVFTAIADSFTAILLRAALRASADGVSVWTHVQWERVLMAAGVSLGLYGFGMSLNDIVDARRDQQLAADRPLPSGRVGMRAAHAVCGALAGLALLAGSIYSNMIANPVSLLLVMWTGALILFYDIAGKYLVAAGLLVLGLIRFFHATFADPGLAMVWHPLWLANHVAIVSAVAYVWEQKRPALTRVHVGLLAAGLLTINAVCLTVVISLRGVEAVVPDTRLLVPLAAAAAFGGLAWWSRPVASPGGFLEPAQRIAAGKRLMLRGLLWLIVYDAAFALSVAGWAAAGAVLLLLPIAYASVLTMRWWARLVQLSRPPSFIRAG